MQRPGEAALSARPAAATGASNGAPASSSAAAAPTASAGSGSAYKPLNVKDALSYLDQVC